MNIETETSLPNGTLKARDNDGLHKRRGIWHYKTYILISLKTGTDTRSDGPSSTYKALSSSQASLEVAISWSWSSRHVATAFPP